MYGRRLGWVLFAVLTVARTEAAPADPRDVDEPITLDGLDAHDHLVAVAALAAKGSFTLHRDRVSIVRHSVVQVLHAGKDTLVIVSSADSGSCHGCAPHAHVVRFVGAATTPMSVSPIDYNGSWGNPIRPENISLTTIAGRPALLLRGSESGGGTVNDLVAFYRLQGRGFRPLGTLTTSHDNQASLGKEDPGYFSWQAQFAVAPDGKLTVAYVVAGAGREHPKALRTRRFAFHPDHGTWCSDGKVTCLEGP